MKKIPFAISLLFAPLAYTIHHFEEHVIFNFREWRLQYFADNNPLSTEVVFLILTAITLVYIILHQILENKASAQSAILFFMASQVHNVIFHAGGTLYFWHFSPGLYTGVLLYLPVNAFIVYKALQEKWLTPRSLAVLFVLGGLIFWAFEAVGPFPMFATLAATYIWIGIEAKKNESAVQSKPYERSHEFLAGKTLNRPG
ncbi:MAG: HXXEE domain-containing protein [bacterium]|nr:HXXEE domain-containing protein [bacterium]